MTETLLKPFLLHVFTPCVHLTNTTSKLIAIDNGIVLCTMSYLSQNNCKNESLTSSVRPPPLLRCASSRSWSEAVEINSRELGKTVEWWLRGNGGVFEYPRETFEAHRVLPSYSKFQPHVLAEICGNASVEDGADQSITHFRKSVSKRLTNVVSEYLWITTLFAKKIKSALRMGKMMCTMNCT